MRSEISHADRTSSQARSALYRHGYRVFSKVVDIFFLPALVAMVNDGTP
jgi:hypothetical protein